MLRCCTKHETYRFYKNCIHIRNNGSDASAQTWETYKYKNWIHIRNVDAAIQNHPKQNHQNNRTGLENPTWAIYISLPKQRLKTKTHTRKVPWTIQQHYVCNPSLPMPHADHMTVVENQRKDSQSAVCLPACNITTNQTQAKLFQEGKKKGKLCKKKEERELGLGKKKKLGPYQVHQ